MSCRLEGQQEYERKTRRELCQILIYVYKTSRKPQLTTPRVTPSIPIQQGPSLASPDIAALQAWNKRVQPLLKDRAPIAQVIEVRSEFSGAGTAEEAIAGVVQVSRASSKDCATTVICRSVADWDSAARQMAELNNPDCCRFSDVMNLAPQKLRHKLEERLTEKALGHNISFWCSQVRLSGADVQAALGRRASARSATSLFTKDGYLILDTAKDIFVS